MVALELEAIERDKLYLAKIDEQRKNNFEFQKNFLDEQEKKMKLEKELREKQKLIQR